jgi:uncharacterized protein (TIGR02611 family)
MEILKRSAVTVVGTALLVVGVALMILPGPGLLLIVAGLAVLATEYAWAHRLLKRAKKQAEAAQQAAVASPTRTAGSVLFALGMVGLGTAMLVVDDVAWPVLNSVLDGIWSRTTGSIIIVTGAMLLTMTYITIKTAKGEPTTYTAPRRGTGGAYRLEEG